MVSGIHHETVPCNSVNDRPGQVWKLQIWITKISATAPLHLQLDVNALQLLKRTFETFSDHSPTNHLHGSMVPNSHIQMYAIEQS